MERGGERQRNLEKNVRIAVEAIKLEATATRRRNGEPGVESRRLGRESVS